MKTLLITGFDPFGGATVNPAWEAVQQLPETVGVYRLCKLQIPTVFDDAAKIVIEKADEVRPSVILCIGQAGGRDAVTPEFVAINHRYASIADNAGQMPQGTCINREAPAAYFATVPVRLMTEAACAEGIRASVSYTAGTFVCNDVLFQLLHYYRNDDIRIGFIHVPYIPSQLTDSRKSMPSMPVEDIVRGLIAAISALDTPSVQPDIKEMSG
ncbi:MAG: pyroglutamyl-peptidase I [Clostridia bacterium]|nr:pyroglutamyl-peptidase I [Clostridia bacterium]